MPRPRGVTTRIFTNRSRAVVLEAEWMVMTQRIANELKPLVKLAKDQGWTIETAQNGTKLVWRGPNGQGPVFTGYRCQGRDLANYRGELVRSGLKLDEETAREHVSDENMEALIAEAEGASAEDVHKALNLVSTSVGMLLAKGELYDKARTDAKEWQEIATEAQDAAELTIKKLSEAETILGAIRSCFNLAPWAILPEIAKLLDIDTTGPTVPLIQPTARRSE